MRAERRGRHLRTSGGGGTVHALRRAVRSPQLAPFVTHITQDQDASNAARLRPLRALEALLHKYMPSLKRAVLSGPLRPRARHLRFAATLAATTLLAGCSKDATGPEPPSGVAGVSVTSDVELLIAVGYAVQLTAKATSADGSVVSGAAFDWQSSNVQVATVSSSGLVTGVGRGTATVTATHGGASGSLQVAVVDADLAAIARLRDDPLVALLVGRLHGDLGSSLRQALDGVALSIAAGDVTAIRDALSTMLASLGSTSDGDEVIALTVLGLVLQRAQRLLNL